MDLELWKNIKKQKKLTIEEIAKRANLPKGSVQNIFCGYVPNPRTDTVEAIEKALGLKDDAPLISPDMPIAFYEGIKDFDDESKQDLLKYFEYLKAKNKK